MPRIVNERYNLHFQQGKFDIMMPKEFYKNLNQINTKTQFKQPLKYFFLLLYWTGRRPSQIAELTRENFRRYTRKGTEYLEIFISPKKGENPVTLYLVFKNIPLLEEAWNWLNTAPPNYKLFWIINSNKPHTVKWKNKKGENKEKTYTRLAHRLEYWSEKFFEIPLYFFRHNAHSYLVNVLDADFSEVKFWKGAKTEKSVACYIHPTAQKMQNIALKLKSNQQM